MNHDGMYTHILRTVDIQRSESKIILGRNTRLMHDAG